MSGWLQLRAVCSFGCTNRLIKPNVFVFTHEVQIIIVFGQLIKGYVLAFTFCGFYWMTKSSVQKMLQFILMFCWPCISVQS